MLVKELRFLIEEKKIFTKPGWTKEKRKRERKALETRLRESWGWMKGKKILELAVQKEPGRTRV